MKRLLLLFILLLVGVQGVLGLNINLSNSINPSSSNASYEFPTQDYITGVEIYSDRIKVETSYGNVTSIKSPSIISWARKPTDRTFSSQVIKMAWYICPRTGKSYESFMDGAYSEERHKRDCPYCRGDKNRRHSKYRN